MTSCLAFDAFQVAIDANARIAERLLAVHVLKARHDGVVWENVEDVRAEVGDFRGHIQVNAADGVDQLDEAYPIDDDVVVDRDVEIVLDGSHGGGGAPARVLIELAIRIGGVDLGLGPIAWSVAVGDVCPEVAGNCEHLEAAFGLIDGGDEHGVAAGRRVFGLTGTAIEAEYEDVHARGGRPGLGFWRGEARESDIDADVGAGNVGRDRREYELVAGEEIAIDALVEDERGVDRAEGAANNDGHRGPAP